MINRPILPVELFTGPHLFFSLPDYRVGRTDRRHRICGHTADRQSTQGDKRSFVHALPSQRLESLFYRRSNDQLSQTACRLKLEGGKIISRRLTLSNHVYKVEGSPSCTKTVQPLPIYNRNNHTSDNPRASTRHKPGQ